MTFSNLINNYDLIVKYVHYIEHKKKKTNCRHIALIDCICHNRIIFKFKYTFLILWYNFEKKKYEYIRIGIKSLIDKLCAYYIITNNRYFFRSNKPYNNITYNKIKIILNNFIIKFAFLQSVKHLLRRSSKISHFIKPQNL